MLIGFCRPAEVDGLFHDSVVGTLMMDAKQRGLVKSHLSVATGPRIAMGRTLLVDAFLKQDACEWLWMLDADMTFPADTLYQLYDNADAKERPIVGGLCFAGGRSARIVPTLYKMVNEEGEMDRIEDYPRDAMVRVDATGAACVLIHRSVFETMATRYPRPYPWFKDEVVNGRDFGEDIVFCLRARSLDIPTYVHTGVRIGHVKTSVVTEDSYDAYRIANAALTEAEQHDAHLRKLGLVSGKVA